MVQLLGYLVCTYLKQCFPKFVEEKNVSTNKVEGSSMHDCKYTIIVIMLKSHLGKYLKERLKF